MEKHLSKINSCYFLFLIPSSLQSESFLLSYISLNKEKPISSQTILIPSKQIKQNEYIIYICLVNIEQRIKKIKFQLKLKDISYISKDFSIHQSTDTFLFNVQFMIDNKYFLPVKLSIFEDIFYVYTYLNNKKLYHKKEYIFLKDSLTEFNSKKGNFIFYCFILEKIFHFFSLDNNIKKDYLIKEFLSKISPDKFLLKNSYDIKYDPSNLSKEITKYTNDIIDNYIKDEDKLKGMFDLFVIYYYLNYNKTKSSEYIRSFGRESLFIYNICSLNDTTVYEGISDDDLGYLISYINRMEELLFIITHLCKDCLKVLFCNITNIILALKKNNIIIEKNIIDVGDLLINVKKIKVINESIFEYFAMKKNALLNEYILLNVTNIFTLYTDYLTKNKNLKAIQHLKTMLKKNREHLEIEQYLNDYTYICNAYHQIGFNLLETHTMSFIEISSFMSNDITYINLNQEIDTDRIELEALSRSIFGTLFNSLVQSTTSFLFSSKNKITSSTQTPNEESLYQKNLLTDKEQIDLTKSIIIALEKEKRIIKGNFKDILHNYVSSQKEIDSFLINMAFSFNSLYYLLEHLGIYEEIEIEIINKIIALLKSESQIIDITKSTHFENDPSLREKCLIMLFSYFTDQDKNKSIQNLFDLITKKCSTIDILPLYILLYKSLSQNQTIHSFVTQFMYEMITKSTLDELMHLIQQISVSIELLNFTFNNLDKYIFNDINDIKTLPNEKEKIIFYKFLKSNGYFNENYITLFKEKYHLHTITIINELNTKITKNNFSINELPFLIEIVNTIYLNDNIEYQIYMPHLLTAYVCFNIMLIIGTNIYYYYDFFESVNMNISKQIKEIIINEIIYIFTKPFRKWFLNQNNSIILSKVNTNDFLFALKNHILFTSKIFFHIFQHIKQNTNIEDLNILTISFETLSQFELLKNLFDNDNFFEQNTELINTFLPHITNEQILLKELFLIKHYFNLSTTHEQIKKIHHKLFLLSHIEEIYSFLSSIYFIYSHLHTSYNNLPYIKLLSDFIKTKHSIASFESLFNNFYNDKSLSFIITTSNSKLYEINYVSIFTLSDRFNLIMKCLYNQYDLFEFVTGKKEDDVRNLIEFIDEKTTPEIGVKDIQLFNRVVLFMNDIVDMFNNNSNSTLIRLIYEFILLVNSVKYPNIKECIDNTISKVQYIKNLYLKIINQNQLAFELLETIYNNSTFKIELINECKCTITYIDQLGNVKSIPLNLVHELKEKCILLSQTNSLGNIYTSNINSNNNPNNNENLFRAFVISIDIIFEVIECHNVLLRKGYVFSQTNNKAYCLILNLTKGKVVIDLKNSIINPNHKTQSIMEFISILKQINQSFSLSINKIYKTNDYMSFIYGDMFQTLFTYVSQGIYNANISHFINTISNAEILTSNKTSSMMITHKNNNNDFLEQISSFITNTMLSNKLNIHQIFYPNRLCEIKGMKQPKGMFTLLVNNHYIEKEVIELYLSLTSNLPLSTTILFCSLSTSFEEINAFVHRALYVKNNILFTIICPENLHLTRRKELLQLINQNINVDILSCFVFVYSDNSSEFISELSLLPQINKFENNNNKPKIEKGIYSKMFQHVEIVYSDAAGVGKSTYIQEKLKTNNNNANNYIYFPIGGNITETEIMTRLYKLTLTNSSVIHIDLLDTNSDDVVRKFLFLSLVTKTYRYKNTYYFYKRKQLSSNDDNNNNNNNSLLLFIIELPFGFFDFFQKFNFLNLIPNKHFISKANLPPLNIDTPSIKSNIQIVVNYLALLSSNHLDSYNITLSSDMFENDSSFNLSYYSKRLTQYNQKQCEYYIFKYFTIHQPTYYQITSFINVLGKQFESISKNIYLEVSQLQENGRAKYQNLKSVRSLLVNALISLTQYFTKGAYGSLIRNQSQVRNVIEEENDNYYDEESINEVAIQQLELNKEIINFDRINPSLVFINDDMQSLSIITTSEKQSNEYKQLKMLWNSSSITTELDLVDYKSLKRQEFLYQVKIVLNINKSLNEINSITDDYVFTADNFIKMILIILRLRSNIPVIMMGETGCGKTSLIRMISVLKDMKLKVFNIHAGVNDKSILSFMEDVVKSANEISSNICVFFDEINTCYSMNLISEIMCKRTYYGKSIPNSISFIAACNPYRTLKTEYTNNGLINKIKLIHKRVNLAYSVHPLPHSLLNFVFDFGNLNFNDEIKYIKSMIYQPIDEMFQNNDRMEDNTQSIDQIKYMAIQGVCESHIFIRKFNDISSVSLREGMKFVIFYKWFNKLINLIIETLPSSNQTLLDAFQLSFTDKQIYCIVLSLFMVYYLRIPSKEKRKDYIYKIETSLKISNFNQIINKVQNAFISHIAIPKGIALNTTLSENLFALFNCINNKIPLFICGKPGNSKTLSVNILFKSMRGVDSVDNFFKCFPRLYMNSYQGALNSTSQGIEMIFNKARVIEKNNKNDKTEDLISMVYFDELGLAELSNNNPLKILNFELENYDINKPKVAFVGISNWCLDYSKLNRGVFISVRDMDVDDLNETAIEIAKAILFQKETQLNHIPQTYIKLYKALSMCYYDFKQSTQNDFHCSRDFYNLIKDCSVLIAHHHKQLPLNEITLSKEKLTSIGLKSISKNFDGKCTSISDFQQLFINKYLYKNTSILNSLSSSDIKYNLYEHIHNNLDIDLNNTDISNRYMMLISKSTMCLHIINILFSQQERNVTYMLGSKFSNDKNDDDYVLNSLNQVRLTLNESKVLVMCGMEYVYPSLYDLFNMNFTMLGNVKTARIAIGTGNNIQTTVNKNFQCVIVVNENEANEQDPPFLNRFEKHYVKYNELLNDDMNEIAIELSDSFNTLFLSCDYMKRQYENMKWCCDDEVIKEMVFYYSNTMKFQNTSDNNKIIKNTIINLIANVFDQDTLSYIYVNKHIKTKCKGICDDIINAYQQNNNLHYNLKAYINTLISNGDDKVNEKNCHVVYTYSKILTSLEIENDINYIEISVSNFKKENEIHSYIDSFYNSNNTLSIIHFTLSEIKHIHNFNHILTLFLNTKQSQTQLHLTSNKHFIYIIHLNRKIQNIQKHYLNYFLPLTVPNLSHIFIDNLNGNPFTILDLINKPSILKEHINFNNSFIDYLNEALTRIDYTFIPYPIDNYFTLLVEYISHNEVIKQTICEKIESSVPNDISNIIIDIHNKHEIDIINDIEFFMAIKRYYKNTYTNTLAMLIYKCEENGVFISDWNTIINNSKDSNSFQTLISNYIKNNIRFNFVFNLNNKNKSIIKHADMNIPGSKLFFNDVFTYITSEKLQINYSFEQTMLKDSKVNDDLYKKIECELQWYEKKLLFQFMKINSVGIYDIFIKLNDACLFEELIYDYISYYLQRKRIEYKIEQKKEIYSFVKILINTQFKDDEKITYDHLAKYILWLESNSNFVHNIINIFMLIYKEEKLINTIKELIQCNKNNKKDNKDNRDSLVLISDTLAYIIITNYNSIISEKLNKIELIYQQFNEFYINIQKCEHVYLKELFILNFIIHNSHSNDHNNTIIQFMNKTNKEYQNKINKENEMLLNDIIDSIDQQYTILNTLFPSGKISLEIKSEYIKNKLILYYDNIDIYCNLVTKSLPIIEETNYNSNELLLIILTNLEPKDIKFTKLNSLIFEYQNTKPNQTCPILFEKISYYYEKEINSKYISLLNIKHNLNNKDTSELLTSFYNSFEISKTYIINTYTNPNNVNTLQTIYHISLIKIFLSFYANAIKNDLIHPYINSINTFLESTYIENNNVLSEEFEINTNIIQNVINNNNEQLNKLKTVLKIYICKCIRFQFDSYRSFITNFISNRKIPVWMYNMELEEQNENIIENAFISVNEYKSYQEICDLFNQYNTNNFSYYPQDLIKYLNKDKKYFIVFYNVVINNIIGRVNKQKIIKRNISLFKNFAINILNNVSFNNDRITKDILSFLFNFEHMSDYPLINESSNDKHNYMLLYANKICLICSEYITNNNSLYKKILSRNPVDVIKESFIPGVGVYGNIDKSYPIIKNFFNTYNDTTIRPGLYICECRYVYELGDCSQPYFEYDCSCCGNKIGGKSHRLNANNYRIYHNQQHRNYVKNVLRNDLPSKLLSDIEEEYKQYNSKGIINLLNVTLYSTPKFQLRKLTNISFRLLNCILYSFLYTLYKKSYISSYQTHLLLPFSNTTFLNVLSINWNLLKQNLKELKINSIEIFMNMIIQKLPNILTYCTYPLTTHSQRENFENHVNSFTNDAIKAYPSYLKTYNKINANLLHLSPNTMQSLINQTEHPKIYRDTEFPLYKYFYINIYPNENHFQQQLMLINDYQKKYPVITAYLQKKNELDLLHHVISLNRFSNFIHYQYGCNITRDEAKSITIQSVINKYQNKIMNIQQLYNSYEYIFNTICSKKKITYRCTGVLEEKTLLKYDSIAHCMNDNGEKYYGMYLAGIYEYLITIHNSFIQNVIESHISNIDHSHNTILPLLITNLNLNDKLIQNITSTNDLCVPIFNDNILHINSFNSLISKSCYKNNFKLNKEINYQNYTMINYDFDYIENELTKILFVNKTLFNEEQIFMIYAYECFLGKNSSLISKFISMYPQEELNKVQLNIINNFIQQTNDKKEKIFFLMQRLFIVLSNENVSPNTKIIDVINTANTNYVVFDNDNPISLLLLNVFKDCENNNSELTMKHVVALYEVFECNCFDLILGNVNEIYKKPIRNEEIINDVRKSVQEIGVDEFKNALRKFISRYICGKRSDTEFDVGQSVFQFIQVKDDIWGNVFEEEKFDQCFDKLIEYNVKLENIVCLYKCI